MSANGNSSVAQPAVKIAKAVYVRQVVDTAAGMPASFGGAAAGAILPSMLSKPSQQLQKAQDQHRAMLQASIKHFPQVMQGSSSGAEPAWCHDVEPRRLLLTAKPSMAGCSCT